MESRVLRQLIPWAEEYERKLKTGNRYTSKNQPTTIRFSESLKIPHEETLKVLNALVRRGLVIKHRRISAGFTGNGFDGALYSGLIPTQAGRDLVAQADKPRGESAPAPLARL